MNRRLNNYDIVRRDTWVQILVSIKSPFARTVQYQAVLCTRGQTSAVSGMPNEENSFETPFRERMDRVLDCPRLTCTSTYTVGMEPCFQERSDLQRKSRDDFLVTGNITILALPMCILEMEASGSADRCR